MADTGSELVEAARRRIGKPFRHHFKPYNLCAYGEYTLGSCMRVGMDDTGYDCTGLVIASLCEVLGVAPDTWNRSFRHANQLLQLAEAGAPHPGDILIFRSIDPASESKHVGIHVKEDVTIHSSDLKLDNGPGVVEGYVFGAVRDVGVIPVQKLAEVGLVATP